MLKANSTLFLVLLSLIGSSLWPCTLFAQTTAYSRLIVFGDSLSDTGNLAFIDLPFPYDDNRISDGPVGVDYIASHIGSNADRSYHLLGSDRGYNYAVAGGNIVGSDSEDLSQQVDAYLDRVNQKADSNALYVLIMGGNDLRGLRSTTNSTFAQQQINLIANTFTTQLNRLISAGAKAIVVSNVPNIGRLPETLERQAQDPSIVTRAEAYTVQYNSVLSQGLTSYISRSDINLILFDFYDELENIFSNAQSFGFQNTTEPCFDPDGFDIELSCLINGFKTRVFFDNVHPSSRTHQLVMSSVLPNLPSLPAPTAPPTQPPNPPTSSSSAVIAPIIGLLLD